MTIHNLLHNTGPRPQTRRRGDFDEMSGGDMWLGVFIDNTHNVKDIRDKLTMTEAGRRA